MPDEDRNFGDDVEDKIFDDVTCKPRMQTFTLAHKLT